MTSAASITAAAFKETLGRYPAIIKKIAADAKPAPVSLEELDKFRYIEAPDAFSKKSRKFTAKDAQKLIEWKLRHGKWRPSLTKFAAALTDETVGKAVTDATTHYASAPSDISGTIKLLATLKGVGPATASLFLSIHDPKNIIFFSDEAYQWLVNDGKKKSLKYDIKEYEALHAKFQEFKKKFGATPIEIEKVAFVIVRESEPVKEKTAPYVPTGKPRGRPAKPDSEKKPKPAPSGRGRGRPATKTSGTTTPGKRGRPAAVKKDEANSATETPASGKKRGRPAATAEGESSAKKVKV